MFSIHASHLNHRLRCPLPGRQRRPITIQTCYYYHQRGGSAVFPALFLSPKCLFMPQIRQRTLKSPYYRSWQGSHHTFIFYTLTWSSLWGVGEETNKKQPLLKSPTPCSEASLFNFRSRPEKKNILTMFRKWLILGSFSFERVKQWILNRGEFKGREISAWVRFRRRDTITTRWKHPLCSNCGLSAMALNPNLGSQPVMLWVHGMSFHPLSHRDTI